MIKEIVIDENYSHVGLFEQMKKGDIFKVPFEKKRYNALRTEKTRQNQKARLTGELKNEMDVKFRISSTVNPGYITICRIK